MSERRRYFLVGCTAGGKAAVGRALAKRLGGQILSVDSMKIYRRMDIGTAKPNAQARAEVPHYGLDLVDPWETFSVADFVEYAERTIKVVRSQGAIPLAVGGTNLYIQALRDGLFEGPGADEAIRRELREQAQEKGLVALHSDLARVDPSSAERIHPKDEKRIFRALEVYRRTGTPISELQTQWEMTRPKSDCVLIGLRRKREDLHGRINARVKRMVELGLVEEVDALLADSRGLSPTAAQAVGYAEIIAARRGEMPLDKAIEKVKINTRRLAKKQRTWQRRWTDVQWFDIPPDEAAGATAERILREVTFE